jgi:adenylate cyclase
VGLEIERRFLVSGDSWRGGAQAVHTLQGYLSTDPAHTVRVRLQGGDGWLTVKGPAHGAARAEFEYPVPAGDAVQLLELCGEAMVEKVRHTVTHKGAKWVVDEFAGDNAPLVIAELELTHEDDPFDHPEWLGMEVTADHRYSNAALAARPYSRW